ncbi:protein SLOW GREEN 1, chloroplastic [Cornus florida]|uniref:protein SLOW GREEN 1, chloroplastic n=1 Tax=Cornus florida TaxID=4283 RepID=UPI00289DF723|nr:protein SLOW GREEN 1, chloroplastic [Cornus florida]
MASLYIKTLSLNPQLELTKIPKRNVYSKLKPSSIDSTHIQKPLYLKLKPFPKLHISPKSSHPFTSLSQLHILHKPTSIFSHISCSASIQEKISKLFTEKIVVLLVGSFILMGSLGARPVMAVPAQKSSYSERMEQKSETLNDKNEEEMYEKLLEDKPRNLEALKVVLYGKMSRGKPEEAVHYVERLIDVEPNNVEWRLLRALCYEMMGQLSKAKRFFKEILKERPLLLRALHGLAMVMHKNHEGPAVFEMLNKALDVARQEKRVTEERSIKILIAQMHVMKGELEEGLENFKDLVNENPRDFRPYLCQGIIYSLLDKKKEAEEQFEIYRSLVPEEFPERGFLDDVVLAAKRESREKLEKDFKAEFSYKK